MLAVLGFKKDPVLSLKSLSLVDMSALDIVLVEFGGDLGRPSTIFFALDMRFPPATGDEIQFCSKTN